MMSSKAASSIRKAVVGLRKHEKELERELSRVREQAEALEVLLSPTMVAPNPYKRKQRRRRWNAQERAAISVRMKRYWAARRAQSA